MSQSSKLGLAFHSLRLLWGKLWLLEARLRGLQLEEGVQLVGRPIMSKASNSSLVLRKGATVVSSQRANPLGIFQPSVLRTLSEGAELVLGENTGISGVVLCAGRSIRIGAGTIIGSGAMVWDNDFHAWENGTWATEYRKNARPVLIGKNVFIGARAIILKGVTIGDHAVIGAGAVVSKDVPSGFVAAGNPAQVFPRKDMQAGIMAN
ncbi:MAG: acyltransferase [Verrucomicrobiales bacterium]